MGLRSLAGFPLGAEKKGPPHQKRSGLQFDKAAIITGE
jgi:hypothetical protein